MDNLTNNTLNLLTKTSESAQQAFNPILNNILLAIIIVLLGLIISRVVGKLIELLFKELEFDKILRKAKIKFSLGKVLSQLVRNIIIVVTIIIALNQIGITSIVLNVLTIIIVFILLISVTLSFKDFIPKFTAGIRIKNKEIIKKGDIITLNDIKGTVTEVTLIETIIETKPNEFLYIPNNSLLDGKLKIKRKKSKTNTTKK